MYIPDELVVEILKRLPVKSLLRCMSVCKSWHSLIKNPNFISTHFNHQSIEEPRYLLYAFLRDYNVYKDDDSFDMHLEFTCPKTHYSVGCCNGIVCFSIYKDATCFILWNSSLRRYLDIKVPYCSVSDDEKTISWFGFDAISNDYKLVWVAYTTSESWETRPLCVYVYSLNERTWRCVNSSFVLDNVHLIWYRGVYLNGIIHWVAKSYYDERDIPVLILTFNLVDETFGELGLPNEIQYVEPDHNQDFSLWPKDSVDLAIVKRDNKNYLAAVHKDLTKLNFWIMEEEGVVASWRKDFSMWCSGLIKKVLNVRLSGEIVLQLENGDVISWDHMLCKMKLISSEEMYYIGTYVENLLFL